VARTAQTYRQAIDDALAGRSFQPELIGVLENLASRGYTDGFYQRHHTHEQQNYIAGYSQCHRQQFCGEISFYDTENRLAVVDVKNKFSIGDTLELILPSGNQNFTVDQMFDIHGKAMQEASGSGYWVKIPIPSSGVKQGLLARYLSDINPNMLTN
jgi:putative protease